MSRSLTDLLFSPTRLLGAYGREANDFASRFALDPTTVHNGEWDAFRHCYGSAAMATDYGSAVASVVGTLKEVIDDRDKPGHEASGEGRMDRANNQTGRELSDSATESAGGDVTRSKIAELCLRALKEGTLIRSLKEVDRDKTPELPPKISKPGAQEASNQNSTPDVPTPEPPPKDGVDSILKDDSKPESGRDRTTMP